MTRYETRLCELVNSMLSDNCTMSTDFVMKKAVKMLAAIDAHCAEREPEKRSLTAMEAREMALKVQADTDDRLATERDLAPTHLTPEEAAELEAEQDHMDPDNFTPAGKRWLEKMRSLDTEPSEPTVQAAQDRQDKVDAAWLRQYGDRVVADFPVSGVGEQEHLNAIADRLDKRGGGAA